MNFIYIAGSLNNAAKARELAKELETTHTGSGPIEVVSQWHKPNASMEPSIVTPQNTRDMCRATFMVFLGDVVSSTGGMWFDLGFFVSRKGHRNVLLVMPHPFPQTFLHCYNILEQVRYNQEEIVRQVQYQLR